MIAIDQRAEINPSVMHPENQGNLSLRLSPYRDSVVNSVLSMISKINPGWTARFVLRGGASAAMALTPVVLAKIFSQNVPVAEAVGENCNVRVLVMGFRYVRNPNSASTNGVINASSLVINEVSMMGPLRVTHQENPDDPKSPKKVIANPSFDQVGNHREVLLSLAQKSNAVGKDQSPALKIGISAEDDLVLDPKTGLAPEIPLIIRCGQDGWTYFGRLAVASAIDQVVAASRYQMYQAGTLVDQITKRVLGRAPGIGPEKDDPAKNFQDFKVAAAMLKQESSEAKKLEQEKVIAAKQNSGKLKDGSDVDANNSLLSIPSEYPITSTILGSGMLTALAGGLNRRFGSRHLTIRGRRIV